MPSRRRLCEEGLTAVTYHAGMSPDARRASQEAFMEDRAEVVVATNAFGMGVDKADVRTVAHWALPTSLEAYYQEAGRGGRDGLPARALLLGARMDLGRLIRFIKERETSVDDVKAYVGARCDDTPTATSRRSVTAISANATACCCRSPSARAPPSSNRPATTACSCA